MARVSFEQKVIALMQSDARLAVVALATVTVWCRVVMLIHQHGDGGLLLRMGFGFGNPNEIAKAVGATETQLETVLSDLVARQLLTRDEEGSLGLPAQLMPTRREIANRNNGKAGGRPRKANPTPAEDPRQRHAPLPIAGGAETQSVTQPHARTRESLSLASDRSLEAQASRASTDEFQRVGRAAFFAAGFDDAKDFPNWGIAQQWLNEAVSAGLTPEERAELIVETVREVAERQAKRGKPPSHLGYFTRAVSDAVKAFQRQPDAATQEASRAWSDALALHCKRKAEGLPTVMPTREQFGLPALAAA